MNSIRPITFVEAPRAASAAFGVAALAVAFLGMAQANAAIRDGAARDSLARAEALPRGVERDAALAQAGEANAEALGVAPKDAHLHARAARVFYLQATTAAIDEVSPALLQAAKRELAGARTHSPRNPSADALDALVDIAAAGGVVSEAAAKAVARSYAAPASGESAVWRLEAAARAWPSLSPVLQQHVIVDGCAQSAVDRAFAAALVDVARAMPESGIGKCGPDRD